MSVIRVLVVDPKTDDVLVYQVPENSRHLALLIETFNVVGLDFTTLKSDPARRKKCNDPNTSIELSASVVELLSKRGQTTP